MGMGMHVVMRWADKPAPQSCGYEVFGPFKTGEDAEEWAAARRLKDGDDFAYTVHPLLAQANAP